MVRKAILVLIVAFAIYFVIATPTTAADVVKGAAEGLRSAGQQVLTFFDALTH